MKKLLLFLAPLTLIFFSCEGDPGPQGPAGLDGVNITANVLEFNGDFTTGNNFSLLFEFPSTIEVFESDVVLVYLLWEVVDGNDIWRPLPQSVFTPDGELVYNFDHTFFDVSAFLDADFDLALATPEFTDNQVFRVAIVPGEFAEANTDVLGNLSSLMQNLELNTGDIIRN